MSKLIEAVNLRCAYHPDDIPILQSVNFRLSPNSFTLVIGPNGSGKTTLLRCIAGFMRFEGEILIGGISVSSLPQSNLIKGESNGIRVAYVPQGHSVFSGLTVRENLLVGGHTLRHRFRETRFREVLDKFPRLRGLLNTPAGLLSGGEQQEVVIARSLMVDPSLLLIDEPMLGLDVRNTELISEFLLGIWRSGTSVIAVEHRTETLNFKPSYVLELKEGTTYLTDCSRETESKFPVSTHGTPNL